VKIQISRAHYPVDVLGPGRRAGLWVQGCSIGCRGCIALDTWPVDPDRAIDVQRILDWLRELPEDGVDGVTISGGEPFDQPEALLELLVALRTWADEGERDLLCYSGRSLTVLRRRFASSLALLDAVITGRFVAARAPGDIWRGSANQLLVPLSDLGHRRYDEFVNHAAERTRLQATVDGSTIWYVGVPRPGELAALTAALEKRGLRTAEASWLP
jgi:anaerobic ribonucleoside-triphosphate reductase activating protein